MTSAQGSPTVLRAAVAVAGVAGLIVLVLILTSTSGGSGTAVPGMPASVLSALGGNPTTVITLHGDVLALTAPPEVQQLQTFESEVAREPYVRAEYGPVTWLDGQFTSIARSVAARTTKRETRADLLVRDGATGGLTLGDQELTSTLIFGTGETPLAGLRWLVPNANTLRIFVRQQGSTSTASVNRALTRLASQSGLSAVAALSAGA